MLNKKILVVLCIFLVACSNKIDINGNSFYLSKTKEYLACIKPLSIEGVDSIYLQNTNGEPVYVIEMYGSTGNCNVYTDEIYFKESKKQSNKEKLDIVNAYVPNIYFTSNISIKFKVTKLMATQELDYTFITIPYFIVLNNKKDNSIIDTKNLTVKINLPKNGSKIIVSKAVKIKQSFSLNNYNDMELLSGIYVGKQI